ncbi:MAG: Enolase [Microgenomates group bacterium GW2011_GWA2_46_7]|nr:MAG: Enolase [Microgenomates group bacterium GW2011_GWA2_46_7]
MPKITRIVAREIIDSRAIPTIEVSVLTDSGHFGTASIPSGASTGRNEDVELRDNDPTRYHGKGVLKAVSNVNSLLGPHLISQEISEQENLDRLMLDLDGTPNESKLGANAILAISIACLKTAASCARLPLFKYIGDRYRPGLKLQVPGPIFNLINGGKHGAGNLDFQEFHVIPSTRLSYKEALRAGAETWVSLRTELIHRNAIHSVGDEGGFAPNLFTNADALELLALVIKNSPYRLNQDLFLGLDVAADEFYQDGKYNIKDSPKPMSTEELISFYVNLVRVYKKPSTTTVATPRLSNLTRLARLPRLLSSCALPLRIISRRLFLIAREKLTILLLPILPWAWVHNTPNWAPQIVANA